MTNDILLTWYTYLRPPIDQTSFLESKWLLIENPNIIEHMKGFIWPKSWLLKLGSNIPKDTILKQTYSESDNHIIISQNHKQNWDYINSHFEVPCYRWFCQTFIPFLKDLGKWCVIVVSGHSIYMVHIQPLSGDMWEWKVIMLVWPLDALLWVVQFFSV